MNKDKKAVTLGLNAVIVAALVLLIFFIMAAVIVTQTGKTSSFLNDCLQKGGSCVAKSECDSVPAPFNCKTSAEVCCMERFG